MKYIIRFGLKYDIINYAIEHYCDPIFELDLTDLEVPVEVVKALEEQGRVMVPYPEKQYTFAIFNDKKEAQLFLEGYVTCLTNAEFMEEELDIMADLIELEDRLLEACLAKYIAECEKEEKNGI